MRILLIVLTAAAAPLSLLSGSLLPPAMFALAAVALIVTTR